MKCFVLSEFLGFLLAFTWVNPLAAQWVQSGPYGYGCRVNALAVSGDDIFAAGYNGIFISTNNGTDWRGAVNGPYNRCQALAVVSSATGGACLLAGCGLSILFSPDAGANWTPVGSESPPSVNALSLVGTDLFAGTYYGAFRLDDDGQNWMPVDSGLTETSVQAFSGVGRSLFAGTDGGVFVTTDRGTHWTTISSGLPARPASGMGANTSVLALLVSGSDLVAGTAYHGVWKRPLSEIAGVEERTDRVPERYLLQQNYPNPFNPSTVIRYQLPVITHVTVKVYDVLGREVATLVNERQNAGSHSVSLNAAFLSSGMYLCRLQAGSYHDVKKLMLLK